VGVESLDHSIAGHLLGCSDPGEGFPHGSFEQMPSEPIGDRSPPGDLGVTLPAGTAAVPASEPALVPQQHGRIAVGAVTDASDVALVTRDVDRSTVVARRAASRSNVDLNTPVDDLRVNDLEAVEVESELFEGGF
jgi:hypothetical protein